MQKTYLQIDKKDNLLVALSDLPAGTPIQVNETDFVLKEMIRQKHKFTISDVKPGDDLYLYGVLIGKATKAIAQGTAITTENVIHASEAYRESAVSYTWEKPGISRFQNRTFDGYHRSDGKVGTRNYWLIIPLTFCENRNVEVVEYALSKKLGYLTKDDFTIDIQPLIDLYREGAVTGKILKAPVLKTREDELKNRLFPNVDGIRMLKHQGGCGGIRKDSDTLSKLLAGYVNNPNVAGATVLSLGCQHTQVSLFKKDLEAIAPNLNKPLFYLEQQKIKSERALIEEAVKQTFAGLIEADKLKRKPAPLNKLVMGLECGGSDGFSGISANPALGYASDLLVALGGTTVLAEFPELNGVEQNLIDRCETKESAHKFYKLMQDYSKAAVAAGSGFDSNPSPGNIKDGLITDAIKSAGAAKKAGTSPVRDVLDYTEPIAKNGLNLLCTPGNDVESTTALAGSGCNLIVFTTGLGTPTGNPVVPVVKLASNTPLYERMNDIIDLNAGTIISGEDDIKTVGENILEYLIDVASGKIETKAERNGQFDFIPWKRGVSL